MLMFMLVLMPMLLPMPQRMVMLTNTDADADADMEAGDNHDDGNSMGRASARAWEGAANGIDISIDA